MLRHENVSFTPLDTYHFIFHYCNFVRSNIFQAQIKDQHTIVGSWTPPQGWIKLNFDTAVPRSVGCIGISAFACDYAGLVLVWSRKKILPEFDVETSELFDAKLAIMLAKEMNFTNICWKKMLYKLLKI